RTERARARQHVGGAKIVHGLGQRPRLEAQRTAVETLGGQEHRRGARRARTAPRPCLKTLARALSFAARQADEALLQPTGQARRLFAAVERERPALRAFFRS